MCTEIMKQVSYNCQYDIVKD